MDRSRFTSNRFLLCASLILVPALVLAIAWYCGLFLTAEEQLAAIEAARFVGDSENAAVLYTEMAKASTPFPPAPHFLSRKDAQLTMEQPWSRQDYPELARYIDGHRELISKLSNNLQFEKCYLAMPFPVLLENRRVTRTQVSPTRHMRGWMYLLVRAANNDIAEARMDSAIEKYACVMRMSAHLYQQPVRTYYLSGLYLEADWASNALKEFILYGRLSEGQLKRIDSALPPAGAVCEKQYRNMCRVDSLVQESRRPKLTLLMRLRILWFRIKSKRFFVRGAPPRKSRDPHIHAEVLARRRGLRVLIALRRHRHRTGRWPDSLNEIQLAQKTLTDPQNGKAFVYKLTEDGFTLYSKGPNGVDDGGLPITDDQRVWPVRLNRPNAKEDRTDDEQ